MRTIKKTFLFAFILGSLSIFQSCNSDGLSSDDYVIDIATVKTIESNQYYLELDNNKTLWPSGTLVPSYQAKDGQRVFTDFTILDETASDYDYAVRINSIYNILTKSIEDLDSENEKEFGNDPINIPLDGIWIGSHYLNIEFFMHVPVIKRHKISLVKNTEITTPDDGYLHLELRYNTYNDVSYYVNKGIVSFDLGKGENTETSKYKGVVLKINSAVNGPRDLVFDYSDTVPVVPKGIEDISFHVK